MVKTKTILITGASSGIGKDACLKLAQRGHKVYAGVRKENDFQELQKLHSHIEPLFLDLQNTEHLNQIESFFSKNGKSLDVLFNNAGIAIGGPMELIPIPELKKQFDINVTSQIDLTQRLLPFIRNSSDGRIIFTGSQSGYFTKPFVGPYSGSKFALEGICDALRVELSFFNIKVILLEPGVVKTNIWNKSLLAAKSLRKKFDPKREILYKKYLDFAEEAASKITGSGTEVSLVSKRVIEAVESKRPCIRYRIGKDAKIQFILSRILPYRVRDFLIKFLLKRKNLGS